MNDRSHRLSLFIGLAIPVAMIVFVAAAIYGPSLFSDAEAPATDFLYAVGHEPDVQYFVRDGVLTRKERPVSQPYAGQTQPVRFYRHDVGENRSREIAFEDARALLLDTSNRSPDGFRLERGRRGGVFPFDYGYDYGRWFLVRNRQALELELTLDTGGYNYYGSFRFLGWVQQ